MQHATLPPDELAKELDVIRREMDMGQDDPGRRSGRRLFETAYTKSPYRFTIIGYPGHLQRTEAGRHPRLLPRKIRAEQCLLRRRRRREERRSRRANQNGLRKNQSARVAAELSCPPNRSKPRRAKSSRKRPSNSAIFISPGTFPNCAIPTCRCSTCWPCCSAADAVRACISKCANVRASCITPTRGLTIPAAPGLFGMSAMVDADKFTAARDAMLAEIEKHQNPCRFPPTK